MSSNSNGIEIKFLSRLASIPIVNSGIGLTIYGYSRIKNYNDLVSAALSVAERSISFVATTTKPVIKMFEKPISFTDNIACEVLNKVEDKFPALMSTQEKILYETKRFYEGIVHEVYDFRNHVIDIDRRIKDYGYNKVKGVLDFMKPFLMIVDETRRRAHNLLFSKFEPSILVIVHNLKAYLSTWITPLQLKYNN